jgi:hypothetical protein
MLWAIMKRIIWKLKPTTIPALKTGVKVAWDLIPITTINGLRGRFFQTRFELCCEQDGDSISRVRGGLCEINGTIELITSATLVQVTWAEEEDT